MKRQAIRKLGAFIQKKLAESSIEEQIELYNALGEVLPTKAEQQHAKQIAWVLTEAQKLQMDFTSQLFTKRKHPLQGDGQ